MLQPIGDSNIGPHQYGLTMKMCMTVPRPSIIANQTDPNAEKAWLAAIVDSSDDAIISKTLDGIVTTWNAAAERIFGYSADEAIGQPIMMLIPADRQDEEAAILEKLRRGERVDHFETVRRTKLGTEIDVSVTSSPVKDANGTIIGASKIVRDISEQKRATGELQWQQATMEHLARLNTMGEMAVGLAHELNQPLASILNYASVSLDAVRAGNSLPQKFTAALQEVVNETLRAREIIRRLRDFIIKRKPVCQEVNINDMVYESLHLTAHDLKLARINTQLHLADDVPLVSADPVQVIQVLINLIRNANEAMVTPNATGLELTIATRTVGKEVIIDVMDQGCGLTDDQMTRLFDRFFSTKPAGLGMGLAISRTIINSLGGRLTALPNHQGVGMTFRITLPTWKQSKL